jgi:hypothetical protein
MACDDVLDLQVGHSTQTAWLGYGVATLDLDELPSDLLLAFFKASQLCWGLMGFHTLEIKWVSSMKAKQGSVEWTESDTRIEEMLRRLQGAIEGKFQELEAWKIQPEWS